MASPKKPTTPGGGQATGEDAAINRIRKVLETRNGAPPKGEIWLGDDAAAVAAPSGTLLLTTDAVVDGVHCDLGLVSLSDLGWKALTAAVSDVAAMGGRPLWALSTVGFPAGMDLDDLDELTTGIADACLSSNCRVVGGDVTLAPRLFVSICVVGTLGSQESDDGSLEIGAVTRCGASPGDQLFVTGPLGGSAAGLRVLRESAEKPRDLSESDLTLASLHRRPQARLLEGWTARVHSVRELSDIASQGSARPGGQERATHSTLSAMIDVSDGLSIDLYRLADASRVGFRLLDVPVIDGANEQDALGGGEDYELVMATSSPETLLDAFSRADLREPIHIGECTEDPSEHSLRGERLGRAGWEHPIGLRH